MDLIDDLRITN